MRFWLKYPLLKRAVSLDICLFLNYLKYALKDSTIIGAKGHSKDRGYPKNTLYRRKRKSLYN